MTPELQAKIEAYIAHLTAEKIKLEAQVQGLESAKAIPEAGILAYSDAIANANALLS